MSTGQINQVIQSQQQQISTIQFQQLRRYTFLNLLFTRLSNQKPLNLMENTEFITQLTEISSLEQLYSINESLLVSHNINNSINSSLLTNLLGKGVKVKSNIIHYSDEYTPGIGYDLAKSGNIFIQISNSYGEVIRNIDQGIQTAGEYSVEWDGKDKSGNKVEEGNYTFKVVVQDREGETEVRVTYLIGKISGVKFKDRNQVLFMGDQPVDSLKIMYVCMS